MFAELEAESERCLEKGRVSHNQLKDWADTIKVYPTISNLYQLEAANKRSLADHKMAKATPCACNQSPRAVRHIQLPRTHYERS